MRLPLNTPDPKMKGDLGNDPYVHCEHITRALNTIPNIGKGGAALLDGLRLSSLWRLDRFLDEVLNTFAPPYLIDYAPAAHRIKQGTFCLVIGGKPHYRIAAPNPAARALADLCLSLRACREVMSAPFIYSPRLTLLMDLFSRHPIANCSFVDGPNSPAGGQLEAEVCNAFVAAVRQTMHERRQLLRAAQHSWALSGQENLENLRRRLDELFDRDPNLTVIHMNLFPSRQHVDLSNADSVTHSKHLAEVREMRDRVINLARKRHSLFGDRRGLVWSIMPSLHSGYFLHLSFFFDTAGLVASGNLNGALDAPLWMPHLPAAERPVVTFPELLGDYLVKIATNDQGAYGICHHDLDRYRKEWVYGPIEATDQSRRDRLYQALSSLAQRRQLVRLHGEPQGPYFGLAWHKRSPRERTPEAQERAAQLRAVRSATGLRALTR